VNKTDYGVGMIIIFNPSITFSIGLVVSVGVVVHEIKKNAIIVIVAKNIPVLYSVLSI
jgi:two-component sensor histidine kinase